MWIKIIAIGIASYICYYILIYYKKFIRKFKLINAMPGPEGHYLIGNALTLAKIPLSDVTNYFNEQHDRYDSSLFRLWLGPTPVVVLSDPDDIQIVTTSRNAIDKGWISRFLKCWIGDGLLTSEGSLWRERRKLLEPTFHQSVLEKLIPTMFKCSKSLVESLSSVKNEEKFDIFPGLMQLSLRVVCETIMGIEVDFRNQDMIDYMKKTHEILDIIMEQILKPQMWFRPYHIFTQNYKTQTEALKILHGTVNKIIERKKRERMASPSNEDRSTIDGSKKNRIILLDFILDQLENSSIKMSSQDLLDEVNTFVFAGSETASSTMGAAIFHLGCNPTIQDKAFEEIRDVLGDSDEVPTFKQLSQLKYMDCIIKETLRLTNPLLYGVRYTTDDIRLAKYVIPAGTQVVLSFYHVHANEAYYSNPEKFDPDHFTSEQVKTRHPNTFLAFSSSYRNCIGQKYAMIEIKIFLTLLLKKYKFKSVSDNIHLEAPIVPSPRDVYISIEPRK